MVICMMLSYKTEIKPSEAQIEKIERSFEVCRKVHNLYLIIALKQIKETGQYGNYREFLTWFYSFYLKDHKHSKQFSGILDKDAIRNICNNVDKSLSKYMKSLISKPNIKDLKKGKVSLYFLSQKNGVYTVNCERHRILIPFYGWLKLKEKGYIPSNSDSSKIVSGYITSKAGRYFVSVNVDSDNEKIKKKTNKIKHLGEPIGIDLGVSHFAVLSDGRVYDNINYGKNIKSVNKQINKLQNSLRRKRLQNRSSRNHDFKGMNYDKNVRALSKQYKRIDDIRDDFINKVIADILSTDPEYIAIEDLIVKEMVKDRTFSKSVSDQTFREFRNRLQKKCVRLGIELRVINRWYPSSKKCHNCGKVKKELQINERIYKCECGYVADRDYNASLNIRDSKDYYIFKLRST